MPDRNRELRDFPSPRRGRCRLLRRLASAAAVAVALANATSAGSGIARRDVPSAPPVAAAQEPGARRDSAEPARREAIQSAEVRWLRGVLETPGAEPAVRRGAAERLLALSRSKVEHRLEAVAVLAAALRSADEARSSAALEAMRSADGELPVELADPLVDLLAEAPEARRESIRAAAARFGVEAVPVLGAMIADAAAPTVRRVAATTLVGGISHRGALEALVAILDSVDTPAPAPPDVLAAACDALEAIFQRRFRQDVEQWRRWWREEGAFRGTGAQELIEALRDRIAELERERTAEQRRGDDLEARIAALYAEVFLALDFNQRQVQTARLLDDPLPGVRDFALGQIDRMLRNGEVPSEELQRALLGRLREESRVALRERVLRTLLDIRRPDLASEIADAFVRETDPGIQRRYLAILQQRPSADPAVVERLVELLGDAQLGEESARVLVRLPEMGAALDPGVAGKIADLARLRFAERVPAFVRLLGVFGGDEDLAAVEALVADAALDRAVRRAGAEAMRLRGRADALARLGSDEAVYPSLVRLLSDPPCSLSRLEQVIAIAPPSAEVAPERLAAVRRIVAALPARDLLAVDELLAPAAWADERLRLELLARVLDEVEPAANANGGREAVPGMAALPPEAALALLLRIGRLALHADDQARLQSVLARIGSGRDPGIDELRFASAVVQQQFDAAWALRPDAEAWLDLLDELVSREHASAGPLRDELATRFNGRLAETQRSRFEALSELVARTPRSGSARGSTGPTGG